jgi:hypothetical protein
VGKFEAVAEGSAGGENRIPQAQGANLHGQINGGCGSHFGPRLTRSRSDSLANLTASNLLVEKIGMQI